MIPSPQLQEEGLWSGDVNTSPSSKANRFAGDFGAFSSQTANMSQFLKARDKETLRVERSRQLSRVTPRKRIHL
jgi:hypothetical protein